jgi:hypothetical protein
MEQVTREILQCISVHLYIYIYIYMLFAVILRGCVCMFGTVGIISVLDGDRNKAVLVAKSFVLVELQWVSLFRETKGSRQRSWAVGWVKDQCFGNVLHPHLHGRWQVL